MIFGFLQNIGYWKIEDRIQFIKLVVFPTICVVSTSPKLSKFVLSAINDLSVLTSPFFFAPDVKVLFDLAQSGSNVHVYSCRFISCISGFILSRQAFFINSIDHIEAEFIEPFVSKMEEYRMNKISGCSNLILCLFDCCSFINDKSPMYSKEIEVKMMKVISIFESILQKENINNCLIYFLINSFEAFKFSTYNVQKNSLISNEESFIQSFYKFLLNKCLN